MIEKDTLMPQPVIRKVREEETAPLELAHLSRFEGNPDFVLSLARGLSVIEAFEGHTEGLSSATIARYTALSRAAVRRILITLELLGYVECDGRVYRLTSRVMRLGFSYLSSNSLATLAQPILERVTELVNESSSLAVLDEDQIRYVARSPVRRVMSVGLSVGSHLPAFCTSMGRVLLANVAEEQLEEYLDRVELKAFTPKTITDKPLLRQIIRRVRVEGFSLVDEELEHGLRSVAVPVKNRKGQTLAAMNIGLHSARCSLDEMIHRLLPILQQHSKMLGDMLD